MGDFTMTPDGHASFTEDMGGLINIIIKCYAIQLISGIAQWTPRHKTRMQTEI